ncbi:MAG: hypothetical protein NUV98_01130 [Candidatus Roizmanbacteria bacterium]|nr:hypothetical protein [Candidatus Roizmanbacteria bacterium]
MSKTIIITAVITAIFTAIAAIVSVLLYLDEKPRISAVGEYATWTTLPNQNFGEFKSYAQVDIRNVGSAAAKEIKLQTPFSGVYTINDSGTDSKEFDKNFSVQDLNPGDGYIIRIWARYSQPQVAPEILITHTRGNQNVDFGYTAKGFIGWLSGRLDLYWPAYCLLFLFAVFLLWNYISYLKTKIKKLVNHT